MDAIEQDNPSLKGGFQRFMNLYWRSENDDYEDVAGFCKSATIEEVAKLDYVLTPGRYVGLEATEDDFDFVDRFKTLRAELKEQMAEEQTLNERIMNNLAKVKIDE